MMLAAAMRWVATRAALAAMPGKASSYDPRVPHDDSDR